jgi:hypothetical protein
MDKKSVDKKIIVKPVKEKVNDVPKKNQEVENILIENFVALQKVMSNLSVKFDSLTTQISKLLELFEMSAKALAEKDFDIEKNNRENAKILEKIENVLEQNKTIARGLTLMHEKIIEPTASYLPQTPQQRMPQRPLSEETKTLLDLKEKQNISMVGGLSEKFHRPISSNGQ